MSRLRYTFRTPRPNFNTGVNDSWVVTSDFIARGNSDTSPYLIPNEVIAGHIAHYLKLPLPPFTLMRQHGSHKGHKVMFTSLQFVRRDSEPDDFVPDICCQRMPDLCTGIVLYDALITNEDRHLTNIQTDSASCPTLIRIIDHDRSIFGAFRNGGIRRLTRLRDRLGMSGGSGTGGIRHCLLNHISTKNYMGKWLQRIESIPDYFIEETCQSVRGIGASAEEVQAAIEFLKHRTRCLREIVYINRAEFRSVDDWGLFL